MSITNFLRTLWVRRNLILTTTVAALVAAMLIISIVPPRYTASARLMLDIVKPDPVTGQAMSSQFAQVYVATQIELIKDYRVAGRVVDGFNWASSPALAEAYRNSDSSADVSFRRWLADRVIEGTDAKLLPGSNILEISYTTDDPEEAATVADALREAYEAETRLMKRRGALRSAEWFSNQTTKLRGDLKVAEDKMTAFERENNIVLEDDMSDAESARLRALAAAQDAPAMPSMGGGVPITSPSQAQLQQIDVAIETATQTLGPNHPRLVALRQQRAAVASMASQELAAARAAARGPSVASGPSAGARFQAQQSKVLAQRGKVAEARQLAVDVGVLREQVAQAAKRTAELQQESESTETGMSFLGDAVAPKSPSFPQIPLIVTGAILLGLAIGTGLAILIEMLYRKIRGPGDLTSVGVPLLGMAVYPLAQAKPSLLTRASRLLPYRREASA